MTNFERMLHRKMGNYVASKREDASEFRVMELEVLEKLESRISTLCENIRDDEITVLNEDDLEVTCTCLTSIGAELSKFYNDNEQKDRSEEYIGNLVQFSADTYRLKSIDVSTGKFVVTKARLLRIPEVPSCFSSLPDIINTK